MHREWRRKPDERNWFERIAVSVFSLQQRTNVDAEERQAVRIMLEEWDKVGRYATASSSDNNNLWLNAIIHCTKVVSPNWNDEVTTLCHIIHKQATQLNILFPKSGIDTLLGFFLDAAQAGVVNKRLLLAIASVLYGNRSDISDERRTALFGDHGLISRVIERDFERSSDERDSELEYAAAQCCLCAVKASVNESSRNQPRNVTVGREEREALQVCERTFARLVCDIVTEGGERRCAADSLRRKTLLTCLNGLVELQTTFNCQLTVDPASLCSALCTLLCFAHQPLADVESVPLSSSRVASSSNVSGSETDSQIEPATSERESPVDRSEPETRSGSGSDRKRLNQSTSTRGAAEMEPLGARGKQQDSSWRRPRRSVANSSRSTNWPDMLAQSRARSAVLLLQIVKSINERSKLTSIWSVFFSASPSLNHAESAPFYAHLLRVVARPADNDLRVRLNLVGTLSTLLDKAKWCWLPARDEPQLRSNYAFIPYSVQLATILRELHRRLFELIAAEKRGSDHTLLVQLVKCLAALIAVTPFDKLRAAATTPNAGSYPSLASRIVAECAALLDRRDANLKVAVLECFSALQKAKLSFVEMQRAFESASQSQSQSQLRFRRASNSSAAASGSTAATGGGWLIDTACALVYNVNDPGDVHDSMPVRIEALRLLGMVAQHRFELFRAAASFTKLTELADAVLGVRNVDTQTRDLQVSTVRFLQQVVSAVQDANGDEQSEPDQMAFDFVAQLVDQCVLRFLSSQTSHVLVRSQLFQLVSTLLSDSLWRSVAAQTRSRLLQLTLGELESAAGKNSCATDALCAASAFLSSAVFVVADAGDGRVSTSLLDEVLNAAVRLVDNGDWSNAAWQSVLKLTEALLRLSEALQRSGRLNQLSARHFVLMLRAPLTVFAREREPQNAARKSADKIALNLIRALVNLIALLALPDDVKSVAKDDNLVLLMQQLTEVVRFGRERMSEMQLKVAVRAPCCSLHQAVVNNSSLVQLLNAARKRDGDMRPYVSEFGAEFERFSDALCEVFATECMGVASGSESFLASVLDICAVCRNEGQKCLLFGEDKRRFAVLFVSALRVLRVQAESGTFRTLSDAEDRLKEGGGLLCRTLWCLLLLAGELQLSDLQSSNLSAELVCGSFAVAGSEDRLTAAARDALSRVAEQHGDDYLACSRHLTALRESCTQAASTQRAAIERLIVILSI